MSSPPEERSPRKASPQPSSVQTPLATSSAAPMPTAGGHAPSPTRFTPKYLPRLISYQSAEYQDENWRS